MSEMRGTSGEVRTSRLVVVPRVPGPLRSLDVGGGRRRDELDELIDEVFGPTTEERPGVFDLALLLLGLGLLAWGFLLGGSELVRWLGAILLLLGIALPARSVIRAYGRVRTRWRQERTIGDGILLDIDDPATEELAAAYEDLEAAVALPGTQVATGSLAAAHAALVEAATLLDGHLPDADAQVAYLAHRTEAIRSLTAQLLRVHQRWTKAAAAEAVAVAAERREWETAVVAARDELETAGGVGAVAELEALSLQLQRDAPDAS